MIKSQSNSQELKDIIGCFCAATEEYNGKSWNNKTQEYDDCGCISKIPELLQLALSCNLKKREYGPYDSPIVIEQIKTENRVIDTIEQNIRAKFQ